MYATVKRQLSGGGKPRANNNNNKREKEEEIIAIWNGNESIWRIAFIAFMTSIYGLDPSLAFSL